MTDKEIQLVAIEILIAFFEVQKDMAIDGEGLINAKPRDRDYMMHFICEIYCDGKYAEEWAAIYYRGIVNLV